MKIRLLFGFHDIKQEIQKKIDRLQFRSFLKVSRADFSHVDIKRGVRGHVSISVYVYFQMTQTSGIHKVHFLEIRLAIKHVDR